MRESNEIYRELILKTTINLYAHYGIKNVSMGQVAGALHMSKKTLYAEFGSKEELLCHCLEYECGRVMNILERIDCSGENAVEKVMQMTRDLFQYKFYFCPAFHRDLIRFKSATEKMEARFVKLTEKYKQYLNLGREQGYLVVENDYTTIATMLVELLVITKSAHRTTLVYTFLRGLCTDRGLEVMDNIMRLPGKEETYTLN